MTTADTADSPITPRGRSAAKPRDRDNGDRPVSMTQVITQQLREAIIDGRFAPGTWIRQEELAREYGVSRVPIRQALHALEGEGWIVQTPYAGARVLGLDLAQAIEIYLMRERLEPLALAQSVPRLSAEQITLLQSLVTEMETVGESDYALWLRLDTQFHLQSYAAAPLPRLLRTVEVLWERAQQYRRAMVSVVGGVEHSQLAHRLIIDAIEQRDSLAAEQLITWHICWTRSRLTQHTELFETDAPHSRGNPDARSNRQEG